MKQVDKYVMLQGTTAQETYKAIDPLERKRELRMLRKEYRAKRRLWRHQERMERIKRTNYYDYNSNFFNGYFYNGFYPNYYYDNYYRGYFTTGSFWDDTSSLISLTALGLGTYLLLN